MGGNKKNLKKKLSKIGQRVKHKNNKGSLQEDEEIILENIEITRSTFEVSGDEHLVPEAEEVALVCSKCQGELSNARGVSSNTRYRCTDCGTLYELVPKGQATGKKTQNKKKKKKLKKAGQRAWRVCVTGWKYLKAGMVFYVHTPANGFNITGMATSHAQNSKDPVYKKYSYVYKT